MQPLLQQHTDLADAKIPPEARSFLGSIAGLRVQMMQPVVPAGLEGGRRKEGTARVCIIILPMDQW